MARRKAFHIKLKHQCHLSQKEEWVSHAQSWEERRLLCYFVFIPIERWTLILTMVEREVFLMKPKH